MEPYINTLIYCLIGLAIIYLWGSIVYRKTDYGKSHKEGLWKILCDNGALGEYKTSRQFEKSNFYHKIIYNCYLPKSNNETTEIDLVAITEKGIWVIENKNYTGWIFGDTYSKKWCQMINKKKYFFYNPIWQNKTHIKYLEEILNNIPENYYKSIIVFNKAKLKKAPAPDNNIYVFEMNKFKKFLREPSEKILKQEEIDRIYDILLPYTKVTKEQKKAHIDNIKKKTRKI